MFLVPADISLHASPAPMVTLPVIGVPFEQVGMDLIGLLPMSVHGHKYIVVIVDYATRCPEAIPLQKATSRSITRELMLIFNWMGILKDLLTAQGTPFMSKLMMDCHQLLQVKHLRILVYHPQTDGLIEHNVIICSTTWLDLPPSPPGSAG